MYCSNCGRHLDDTAYKCHYCGTLTNSFQNTTHTHGNPVNYMGVIGFVLSFVLAIPGFVCSLIGYMRSLDGADNKGLSVAGIIISTCMFILTIVSVILLVNSFSKLSEIPTIPTL